MNRKHIYIGFGVAALIVVVAITVVVLRNKKDNEAGIIDWISSKTE